MKTTALVLAAGKGTRMKADIPKCAFPILDKPIIEYVVERFEKAKLVDDIILVVGYKKQYFYDLLDDRVKFSVQKEQNGTGDAVKSALPLLCNKGITIIVPGDVPLMTKELTDEIIKAHIDNNNDLTVCTMEVSDPFGYGRIKRDAIGKIKKIVEQKNATKEEELITEVNTGVYVVDNNKLIKYINKIEANPVTNEYYLTDIIELMNKDYKLGSFLIEDSFQTLGINDLNQANLVSEYLKETINKKHLDSGVIIEQQKTVTIGADVKIESGATIKQNTIIAGKSTIKKGSIVGPNTTITDGLIASGVKVEHSVINNSTIGKNSYIGPFSYIRDNSIIGENVRAGNYVEIKNSIIGSDSFASHHSYIGDATIGKRANFGSGSVIVNFDGKEKYETVIGDDVFIGCNVNIIAPIEIASNVIIAAGSTITDNIEAGSLAIARSRQINKENFYYKHFKDKKEE